MQLKSAYTVCYGKKKSLSLKKTIFVWAEGWQDGGARGAVLPVGAGLPSVDLDSLAVLTYARFTGGPPKVHEITKPWPSPSGALPVLRTSHGETISVQHKIITHLRKEKYNAADDLPAQQGADTSASTSLLEEKLLPILIHPSW